MEHDKTFTLLKDMPTGADGEIDEDENFQRKNYNKKTIPANKYTKIK